MPADTSLEMAIMRALLAAAGLSTLAGTALANHECRAVMFETVGGRAAKLVPIAPNAHCGTRGRAASTPREARIEAYFDRRTGSRASPRR